mmetsp:Transcript_19162/g.76301  ORF Transcript_19162/g.76301 Transcript_19162/m.76301 type:complete len:255 (-) Transcript_19162:829-1593(-)
MRMRPQAPIVPLQETKAPTHSCTPARGSPTTTSSEEVDPDDKPQLHVRYSATKSAIAASSAARSAGKQASPRARSSVDDLEECFGTCSYEPEHTVDEISGSETLPVATRSPAAASHSSVAAYSKMYRGVPRAMTTEASPASFLTLWTRTRPTPATSRATPPRCRRSASSATLVRFRSSNVVPAAFHAEPEADLRWPFSARALPASPKEEEEADRPLALFAAVLLFVSSSPSTRHGPVLASRRRRAAWSSGSAWK